MNLYLAFVIKYSIFIDIKYIICNKASQLYYGHTQFFTCLPKIGFF